MFDQDQVEALLYHEAELLDNKSLAAWLELLTEDVLYRMPLKRDQHEEEIHNSLFYEDHFLLKVRIERLNSPRVFSQQPPSYCQHVLQRPQITDVSEDACHTRTPFVYLESQLDEQIVLAGVAHHELVREDAELKIRRKRIELLNREASLPSIQLLL